MSESKIPTLKPIFDSEIARLEVIVDLPTPPFPDEIAMTLSIPANLFLLSLGNTNFFFSTLKLTIILWCLSKELIILFSNFFFACNDGLSIFRSIIISVPKILIFLI